jgi:hypothetical protein
MGFLALLLFFFFALGCFVDLHSNVVPGSVSAFTVVQQQGSVKTPPSVVGVSHRLTVGLSHVNHSPRQSYQQQQKYQPPSSWNLPLLYATKSSSSTAASSSSASTSDLKDLFGKYSDDEDLLSKSTLETMAPFSEMLVSSWVINALLVYMQ